LYGKIVVRKVKAVKKDKNTNIKRWDLLVSTERRNNLPRQDDLSTSISALKYLFAALPFHLNKYEASYQVSFILPLMF
jgi:hypothetical protein